VCEKIIDEGFKNMDQNGNQSDKLLVPFRWVAIAGMIIMFAYMCYSDYNKKEPYEKLQATNLATTNIALLSKDSVKSIFLTSHSA